MVAAVGTVGTTGMVGTREMVGARATRETTGAEAAETAAGLPATLAVRTASHPPVATSSSSSSSSSSCAPAAAAPLALPSAAACASVRDGLSVLMSASRERWQAAPKRRCVLTTRGGATDAFDAMMQAAKRRRSDEIDQDGDGDGAGALG
eukprot:6019528-Pleurochrysis_carterae.AAC.1